MRFKSEETVVEKPRVARKRYTRIDRESSAQIRKGDVSIGKMLVAFLVVVALAVSPVIAQAAKPSFPGGLGFGNGNGVACDGPAAAMNPFCGGGGGAGGGGAGGGGGGAGGGGAGGGGGGAGGGGAGAGGGGGGSGASGGSSSGSQQQQAARSGKSTFAKLVEIALIAETIYIVACIILHESDASQETKDKWCERDKEWESTPFPVDNSND